MTAGMDPTDTSDPLNKVSRVIRRALAPAQGRLGEMIQLLLEGSGKKLRPRLVLGCATLASEGAECKKRSLFKVAAAVEMIHTASLVHDDIIDEARCRRGRETPHLRWGSSRATLAGDFLLSRAFALLSLPGSDIYILRLLTRTVSLLCRGELCQMSRQYCWDLSEDQYYKANYFKTAQFIAACCESGARIAGASAARRRALHRFGLKLGQAFQIVDDLLDYAGYPAQMGKPAGNDLEQGRATLPLIHLFATQNRYLKLVQAMPQNSPLPLRIQEVLREAVKHNGSMEYAFAAARKKQEEAVKALQQFPPSPERQLLTEQTLSLTAAFSE